MKRPWLSQLPHHFRRRRLVPPFGTRDSGLATHHFGMPPDHALDPFRPRRRGVVAALGVLLGAAVAFNLGMGTVVIAPSEVVGALADRLGLDLGTTPSPLADSVVWDIRMPRVLMGAIGGAAFAVAGAVLQGVFRNRLADPHLLGIGPGASLGGVIGALAGGTEGAIAGGAAGGILAAIVIKRLGHWSSAEPSRFVLIGVALGLVLTAWVGFVVFLSDATRVPPIEFWLLGNLAGSTWSSVGTTLAIAGLGVLGLMAAARTLDLLALGEADARRLGVDVDLAVLVLVLAVGAVTGAAVGGLGVVVFVGLVVPHVVRRLAGPAHRTVLVGSAVGGAVFMLGADLVARIVASPTEVPVGLVTAAIGGPFFLWLIRRPEVPT